MVIGLAITGIPLVKVLDKLGARVIVNDLKSREQLADALKELEGVRVEYILGKHPEGIEDMEIDLVVVSPGVPLELPFIKALKEAGKEIIGEIELAYRLADCNIVAITGTNGKTTTTSLTGEIFKNAQKSAYVVGNIGVAAISKALEIKKEDYMIMEVSSFQLESIVDFRPRVAAILNLTPDHLNRHKTMENYQQAKFNLFKNQGPSDYAVINYDDEILRKASESLRAQKIYFSRKTWLKEGVWVEDGKMVAKINGPKIEIMDRNEIKIPGDHNLENALAAAAMAYVSEIDPGVIAQTLRTFQGVAHRLEYVDTIKGIDFINDSKGTNPDASIKALEAISRPIVLLAGGMDKGSDFTEYIRAFQGKVRQMIVYGETAEKLLETAKVLDFDAVKRVKDLEEAVPLAFNEAKEGDTVLLSPACASWDMYPNFEERGRHFKNLVSSLRRA